VYQEYDWCYQKFIDEGMNHEEMANEADASVRVIKKWCVERHRLTHDVRREVKKLNNIQYDLTIGSVLGDGHITNENYVPLFIVSHAEDEKDYLYWKHSIMKDLCNMHPRYIEPLIKEFKSGSYLSKPAYRFNTRVQDCFANVRDMSKKEVISSLNEFSLCIWLLDDGYRGRSNWQLCIADFDKEESSHILNTLKERFNLIGRLRKDIRYIDFDAKDTRRIDKMILNNIPNELDVVKKKIIDNDSITSETNYNYIDFEGEYIGLSTFCRKNKLNYEEAKAFYLSGIVEGDELLNKFV